MRVLVISDIHGNFQALEKVLFAASGIDQIWVLGDITGYGPSPAECLALLKEKANIILCGNHDLAVCGLLSPDTFNSLAAAAVEYSRKLLTDEELFYLKSLEPQHNLPGISLVHGSPRDPAMDYLLSESDADAAEKLIQAKLCLFGHTHMPGCFIKTNGRFSWYYGAQGKKFILDNSLAFCNPGSVGQPRDGDPRASFALLDLERGQWTVQRTSYDIKAVQNKMKSLNAPEFLIQRLEHGR